MTPTRNSVEEEQSTAAKQLPDDQQPPASQHSTAAHVDPETRVPVDADVFVCPYCDRPFPRERLRDLHLGEEHDGVVTDTEREAYEDARDDEGDDLFVYHLLVIGGLVALYAMLIIFYMIVLGYQG